MQTYRGMDGPSWHVLLEEVARAVVRTARPAPV